MVEGKSKQELKIVLLGEPGVGKSSFRRDLMGKKFRKDYFPTMGADFSIKEFHDNNKKATINIWDLSGQHQFFSIHPQYYIGAHGGVLIYDIDQEDPLSNLTDWIDRYLKFSGNYGVPLLLLQSKIDLIESNDEKYLDLQKKMLTQLNEKFGDNIKLEGMRISSKTSKNVHDSFNKYISNLMNYYLKNKLVPSQFAKEEEVYSQFAYLFHFDDTRGPVILSSHPAKGKPKDGEISSAVSLSTSFSYNDLILSKFLTGVITWNDPISHFYYIAFLIKSPQARSGYILYFIGCTIRRELRQFISQLTTKIEGFLHKAMNRFHAKVQEFDFDLTEKEEVKKLNNEIQNDEDITNILADLKSEVNNLIKDNLTPKYM